MPSQVQEELNVQKDQRIAELETLLQRALSFKAEIDRKDKYKVEVCEKVLEGEAFRFVLGCYTADLRFSVVHRRIIDSLLPALRNLARFYFPTYRRLVYLFNNRDAATAGLPADFSQILFDAVDSTPLHLRFLANRCMSVLRKHGHVGREGLEVTFDDIVDYIEEFGKRIRWTRAEMAAVVCQCAEGFFDK